MTWIELAIRLVGVFGIVCFAVAIGTAMIEIAVHYNKMTRRRAKALKRIRNRLRKGR